ALPPLLPFFAPLRLELVTPPAPIAHPFDDGTVVIVERSVEHTASRLRGDAADYRRLMHPLAARAPELLSMVLGPPRPPRHPLLRPLTELGGSVRANHRVASVDELPPHRAVLLDLAPKGMLEVAGSRFPQRYRNDLAAFRYGPGAFKLDWTLDAPIPWKSADCLRAATVHLGGTMDEIAESELQVAHGGHPSRPFVPLT